MCCMWANISPIYYSAGSVTVCLANAYSGQKNGDGAASDSQRQDGNHAPQTVMDNSERLQ